VRKAGLEEECNVCHEAYSSNEERRLSYKYLRRSYTETLLMKK